jgi:hypothetical protein
MVAAIPIEATHITIAETMVILFMRRRDFTARRSVAGIRGNRIKNAIQIIIYARKNIL